MLCVCNADNRIGDKGAKAIGDALAPRQNPDGSWVFNGALKTLGLDGASPLARHPPASCLLLVVQHGSPWPRGAPGNGIGADGAKALADALAPRQEANGKWQFNGALNTLDLHCKFVLPLRCPEHAFVYVPTNQFLTVPCVWDADNKIGDGGAKAIGGALAPRQNPDGTWIFNGALNRLNLPGASPCGLPPICCLLPASCWLCSTAHRGPAMLQGTALEPAEPRHWHMRWPRGRTPTASGSSTGR